MQMMMITAVIPAVLGTLGIHYICSLGGGTVFSNSVFSALVFLILCCLWQRTAEGGGDIRDKRERRKLILYAEGTAYFFALTMVLGYQLKAQGYTDYGFGGKGRILLYAFCLSAAVFPVTRVLFRKVSELQASDGGAAAGEKPKGGNWKSSKVFFCCWGIILICWLPVFLAYYPAVMAYDFHRQSREAAFGPPYFNSHHPLIHTFLIWVFFQVGKAFGSLETGMACYSIFQMLLLSVAFAYAVTVIYGLCKRKAAVIAATAFFGLFPYCSIMAVSVTKDVIFTALFLIFFLLLTKRVYFRQDRRRILSDIAIFAVGTLMLLFRYNAIYAVACFAVFFVLAAKGKERLRTLALCVLIIAAGKASLAGLEASLAGLGVGSDSEKYSVMIQQMARAGYYHGGSLDEESRRLLGIYVPEEKWQDYNPPIADTVKVAVPYDAWNENIGEMWKVWAKIGVQYPNEYLDAFLCLSCGYWFWDDVTWAENLGYGLEERKGALFTFNSTVSDILPEGIDHESKLPWLESLLEEVVSNNCFYEWPVLSNLFKPSFYCWILGICMTAFLYLKRKNALILSLLPFFYLATLLMGPVVIVRYMLPVLVSAPVLLAMLFYRE